jgi:UDP-3-O-[3-hydroxymyristoyl] glucosamine N-acyltransferase
MTTVAELASRFAGEVRGDSNLEIRGVASLASAGAHDISYLGSKKYYAALGATGAGAVILTAHDAVRFARTCLIVENPRLCFARVSALLNPRSPVEPGVHPSAFVDERATVATSAYIGAYSVVEAGAVIGENVFVGSACYLSKDVHIGQDSWLHARVMCVTVIDGSRYRSSEGYVLVTMLKSGPIAPLIGAHWTIRSSMMELNSIISHRSLTTCI